MLIDLDKNTEQVLNQLAQQQGKNAEQWLKEMIAQLVQCKTLPKPSDLLEKMAVDKIDLNQPLLPDEFFAALDKLDQARPLSELIGKGKGCFKSAAEVDAFIRAERDAWED